MNTHHLVTRMLSFMTLLVLLGVVPASAQDVPGADFKIQQLPQEAFEKQVEAEAEVLDPVYAELKVQHSILMKMLLEGLMEIGAEVDAEGGLPEDLPADLRDLVDLTNSLVEEIELTEGRRYRNERLAAAASLQAEARITTKASYSNYELWVYRDPSVPSSIATSTLTGYVNTAMNRIRSAVQASGGCSFNWRILYQGSYNISGCSTSNPPSGSGSTFKVYFRYGESNNNGWAVKGNYAVIDLNPTCIVTVNWFDDIIVTHELGHVFGADHAPASCTDLFNDKDCGSIECGFDLCDLYTACVMEYADGGTGTWSFCGDDANKMEAYSCPPPTYCGDGTCNGSETCSTCSTDCGGCSCSKYCTGKPNGAPCWTDCSGVCFSGQCLF